MSIWAPLTTLESSMGVLIRGLTGSRIEWIYNILSLTRIFTLTTIVFGGILLGFSFSKRKPKLEKEIVTVWLLLSIIIIGLSFGFQAYEIKVEQTKEYSPPFSYSKTIPVRLQIPSNQHGIFWCIPEKALDQTWIENAVKQAKLTLPKNVEIIKIDKTVLCKTYITVTRTYFYFFPKPPYDVEIKIGEYTKRYKNVATLSKETPWLPLSQKIEVYVYPQTSEDITVTFTVHYFPKITIHYLTVERPYMQLGLLYMPLGYIVLTGLNMALIVFTKTEEGINWKEDCAYSD